MCSYQINISVSNSNKTIQRSFWYIHFRTPCIWTLENTNRRVSTYKNPQFRSAWAKLYAVSTNKICRTLWGPNDSEIQTKTSARARKHKARVEKTLPTSFSRLRGVKVLYELSSLSPAANVGRRPHLKDSVLTDVNVTPPLWCNGVRVYIRLGEIKPLWAA